eukprot:SAG31_NODE_45942_length_256_cov_1.312102_1_plen_34_part_10
MLGWIGGVYINAAGITIGITSTRLREVLEEMGET